MDQDCIKLTSHFTRRQTSGIGHDGAAAGMPDAAAFPASILLRGTSGSRLTQRLPGRPARQRAGDVLAVRETIATGSRRHVESALDRAGGPDRPELITLRCARLLSGDIDPVGLRDEAGEATRMTVYLSRADLVYQVPAFEVICGLLHRRGLAGATTLAGVSGTLPGDDQVPRLASRATGPPVMVTAVGSGARLGLILPELGGLLRRPLIALEQVRVCKRDGMTVSPPQDLPETDPDGRPQWQRLTIYACEAARHDGQPMHQAITRRLHDVGISTATLHGLWGYRGAHAPHGGRHLPAVTTITGRPPRISAAFAIIDELTAARGLVTIEPVTAVGTGGQEAAGLIA